MSASEITMRILRADAGVVGYVSSRVHPGMAPQESDLPNIVVSLISEDQDLALSGPREGFTSRVSIACHADYYTIADAIGEKVKAAMAGVIHTPVYDDDASPPDFIATATAWKAGTDIIDHDDQRRIFRRILDYRVRWVK